VRYIEEHRNRFGVEPICRELAVAPSTFYAARARPPSARALSDEALKPQILKAYNENFHVYGARKIWLELNRRDICIGRDRVARLMRDLGISGVVRGKTKRTTHPGDTGARPPDLVDRDFNPPAPNRLWVADLTYVRTWAGFVYVAFVIDAFSRMIVGWQIAGHLRTDLALDALEMALWQRQGRLDGLVHHSDRGVQYLAIRYTERLAEAGAVTSVGSRGDSYDNALAESTIGLYKTELIRRRGPWRTIDDVELATLEWIDWFNHRRLHSAAGDLPPAEYEDLYYRSLGDPVVEAGVQ
jgi:putative transposase